MSKQRLHKILAAAGVASRRKAEQLILDGEVRVNGRVVDSLPAFADPQKDRITVAGRTVRPEPHVYYLLNKPRGVICTNSDPQGRKRAVDLVPSDKRLVTAGRLDADTTGLIVLTNDTELVNKLTHPRYCLPKTYVAVVNGRVDARAVEKLKKGVWLAEGKTAPASVKILKRGHSRSLLQITITQGLNRQVRRMLARVGLPVKSLKRTRIGRLTDRGLSPGRFRPLTKAEVAYLKGFGSHKGG
ncbi:MAG TPA: rRNA pseudouridine synthase [Phycisphaerales bacterium]|nr:rRNA pseudouridine synthase [Phycisphaerales bacterium]